MSTLHVITHALLWSLMEVETEGKRGWMYDSQTQCSGILAFTWYHIVMNRIAMMTVTFILRPNLVDKTPEEIKQQMKDNPIGETPEERNLSLDVHNSGSHFLKHISEHKT